MNEKPRKQGFQVGGGKDDLFESAAPFYTKYRRPYPGPVVNHLVKSFGLDGCGRLLDAGCGTGQVFQVVAEYFEEVIAIAPDKEMVRFAEKTAADHGLHQVTVLPMRGEEIDERLGTFRMAIFGASFHWMDRQRVGELVYNRLEPGGHLVMLCPGEIQSGTTEWEAEVRAVVQEWLGQKRRAGRGFYQTGERHGEVIRRTRFREITETDIHVREEWSVDQIVGYLFSTSYASQAVLGERAGDFEETIRERLLKLRPDGHFEKVVEHTVICATRPLHP